MAVAFAKLIRPDGSTVLVAAAWVVDIVPATLLDIQPTKTYRTQEEALADLDKHTVIWLSGGRHHVVRGSMADVAVTLDMAK